MKVNRPPTQPGALGAHIEEEYTQPAALDTSGEEEDAGQDLFRAPGSPLYQPNAQPDPPLQSESADPTPIEELPLLLLRKVMADDAHHTCGCPKVCEPDLLDCFRQQANDIVRQET